MLLAEKQTFLLEAIDLPIHLVVVDRQFRCVRRHQVGMPLPLKGAIEI